MESLVLAEKDITRSNLECVELVLLGHLGTGKSAVLIMNAMLDLLSVLSMELVFRLVNSAELMPNGMELLVVVWMDII